MTANETKTCTKCGEAKPLPDGFYYEKGQPRSKCKDCHKAKVYALRDADRDAHNAKRRDYATRNPEKITQASSRYWTAHKDEINAARREDRTTNPAKYSAQRRRKWERHGPRINADRREAWPTRKERENAKRRAKRATDPRIRKAERQWRIKNRERANAAGRAYYAKHPEKWENARRAREARKAGVEHQPYTRREIFERDGGICRGCGKELVLAPHGFQIDHTSPSALVGRISRPTCS